MHHLVWTCKWQFQLKIIFRSFKYNQANFLLKILIDCNFYQVSQSSIHFAEAALIPNKFNCSTSDISLLILHQKGDYNSCSQKQHLYIFFLEFYKKTFLAANFHWKLRREIKMERKTWSNQIHSLFCDVSTWDIPKYSMDSNDDSA